MIRYDLAEYLTNIHALMESQKQVGAVSQWLTDEYARAWEAFKEDVAQEKENARTSGQDQRIIRKEGTDLPRNIPGLGFATRHDPG